MSVFRLNRNKNYTVMSNYHFKDKNLSLKAKGLLSQMLSLPDDWDYTIAGLCKLNKENETAIRTALNELKEFGYLVVIKLMPDKTESGRIEYIYDIYESPRADNQSTEKQGIENLGLENQPQLNTNNKGTKELNTKDTTNTNVLVAAEPQEFGNKEINDLFKIWEDKLGFKVDTKVKQNRYACQRLLKSRGFESIVKVLDVLAEAQQDQYAPTIYNFMDLADKWNHLGVWYQKKLITRRKRSVITV